MTVSWRNQSEEEHQQPAANPIKLIGIRILYSKLKQLKKNVLAARGKLAEVRKVQQKATAEFYWQLQEPSDKQSKANTDFIETVESIQI